MISIAFGIFFDFNATTVPPIVPPRITTEATATMMIVYVSPGQSLLLTIKLI